MRVDRGSREASRQPHCTPQRHRRRHVPPAPHVDHALRRMAGHRTRVLCLSGRDFSRGSRRRLSPRVSPVSGRFDSGDGKDHRLRLSDHRDHHRSHSMGGVDLGDPRRNHGAGGVVGASQRRKFRVQSCSRELQSTVHGVTRSCIPSLVTASESRPSRPSRPRASTMLEDA